MPGCYHYSFIGRAITFSQSGSIYFAYYQTVPMGRAPRRHDNIDFQPIIIRTFEIRPLSIAVCDKGYDSEGNHVLVRECLKAYSIIPARYPHVPICMRTHGRYRKQMKRGYYSKPLYNQRNKDETIMSSVIKNYLVNMLLQG